MAARITIFWKFESTRSLGNFNITIRSSDIILVSDFSEGSSVIIFDSNFLQRFSGIIFVSHFSEQSSGTNFVSHFIQVGFLAPSGRKKVSSLLEKNFSCKYKFHPQQSNKPYRRWVVACSLLSQFRTSSPQSGHLTFDMPTGSVGSSRSWWGIMKISPVQPMALCIERGNTNY